MKIWGRFDWFQVAPHSWELRAARGYVCSVTDLTSSLENYTLNIYVSSTGRVNTGGRETDTRTHPSRPLTTMVCPTPPDPHGHAMNCVVMARCVDFSSMTNR
eukprot:2338414-Pyramimonas_sp.AAC.1